jgi:hypothetical protein
MKNPWLSFDVCVIRSGQPRPYADSVYEYEIINKSETKFDKSFVLKLCVQFLRKTVPEKEKTGWWEAHYTFEQIDDRTFRYVVVEPYTD